MIGERKGVLLMERADIEHQLQAAGRPITSALNEYLELLSRAQLSYDLANAHERRELLSALTSNRLVIRKDVVVELREPFRSVAECVKSTNGDPHRDIPRTVDKVFYTIQDFVKARG